MSRIPPPRIENRIMTDEWFFVEKFFAVLHRHRGGPARAAWLRTRPSYSLSLVRFFAPRRRCRDIVGFAIFVLAHDLNAITLDRGRPLLTVQRDTAPRLLRPGLGIIAEHMADMDDAAEYNGRRPHFADQDLVVILVPFFRRAEVEVSFEAADMVFIRMAEQKTVDK